MKKQESKLVFMHSDHWKNKILVLSDGDRVAFVDFAFNSTSIGLVDDLYDEIKKKHGVDK